VKEVIQDSNRELDEAAQLFSVCSPLSSSAGLARFL
jgi:hypothetical protein